MSGMRTTPPDPSGRTPNGIGGLNPEVEAEVSTRVYHYEDRIAELEAALRRIAEREKDLLAVLDDASEAAHYAMVRCEADGREPSMGRFRDLLESVDHVRSVAGGYDGCEPDPQSVDAAQQAAAVFQARLIAAQTSQPHWTQTQWDEFIDEALSRG